MWLAASVDLDHCAIVLDANSDNGRDLLVEYVKDGIFQVAHTVDPSGNDIVEHGLVAERLEVFREEHLDQTLILVLYDAHLVLDGGQPKGLQLVLSAFLDQDGLKVGGNFS